MMYVQMESFHIRELAKNKDGRKEGRKRKRAEFQQHSYHLVRMSSGFGAVLLYILYREMTPYPTFSRSFRLQLDESSINFLALNERA